MKKFSFLVLIALFMWACGDSTSADTDENYSSEAFTSESSSSLQSSSSNYTDEYSADSNKDYFGISSSSTNISSAKEDSSSSAENSSSSTISSSSEVANKIPCRTETEDNCEYGTLLDERDGTSYKTVKIRNTWWMAENLNYADSAKTPSLKGKSWCLEDDPENCAKFGRLYTWAAAIDSVKFATDAENPQDCGDGRNCVSSWPEKVQGICPDGWLLPDYDQLYTLFVDVGGYAMAGMTLKSQTGWSNNGNGKNSVGFNVLQSGIRFANGSFEGDGAVFWSSTECMDGANTMYFYYEYEYSGILDQDKSYAFSIRCVKDVN